MRKLLSLTLLVVVAAVALSGPRVSAVPADPEVPQLSRLLAQRAGSRGGGGAPSQCDVVGFLTGRVTSVDVATSAVTVQTATGSLTAGFPDTTVSTAKPGDDVLVGITLINTRTATIGGSVARLDQANGRKYLSVADGMADVRGRWTVSYRWEDWRNEVPWMSLYFTFGVWSSIWLVYASLARGPGD